MGGPRITVRDSLLKAKGWALPNLYTESITDN